MAVPRPMRTSESTAQVRHRVFDNVLTEDKLTLGVIAPVEGYPDAPWPPSSNREVNNAVSGRHWCECAAGQRRTVRPASSASMS